MLVNLHSLKAFSKNLSFLSISIYSGSIIPYLGLFNALFFERSNITDFLDRYSQMHIENQVDKDTKIK